MNIRSASRHACLFLLTGLVALVLAADAEGVEYAFGQHPDKERVVFDFPDNLPRYQVERTGSRELTLRLPQGGAGADGALPDFDGSRLVSGLRAVPGGVRITLKTPSFGYVAFALDDAGKVVVDVFSDPLGARWKPTGPPRREPLAAQPDGPVATGGGETPAELPPAPAPEPDPPAANTVPEPPVEELAPSVQQQGERQRAAEQDAEPATAPDRTRAPATSNASAEPSGTPDRAGESLSESTAGAASEPPVAQRKRTLYEVPYVFRGKVTPPGQEAPSTAERVPQYVDEPAAPPPVPAEPGASGVSADTPEAEPASQALPVPAQEPAADPAPAAPVPGKSGRFAVAPPPATGDDVRMPAAPSGQNASVQNASARPEPTASQAPPPESEPIQREVVERLTENMLGGETPASNFRGRVFKPGSDSAAPLPSATAPLPQPPAETEDDTAPESAAEPAQADAPVAPAQDEAEEAAVADAATAVNATQAAREARLEKFDDIMFAARTAQGAGDHDTALEELNLLLRQPDLPKDMAEETMYMKADVLSSKYKDNLEEHFDEVNGAYEAAINYNLESWRVPAALLKRGVMNLKVGNVPEAAAFFRILREKYEGDPNVPLTYYYWGDYYFKQGDFQKAADEFQYLVQVYPDSKFVREASLGLARALRNLGYDKQAFQIVDYIEKRWPRFYVEFPPFLRLLGDAAYKVENYGKAKDEYWTYYNIDPKGDEADIILARLGDIYVRTGKPVAARELYQKAVADFPDREGGLISRMRLAEEGIYDRPSMDEMFTVFDRPLNLAPADIYNDIVVNHPESPLAPLAQLKLAMWHLWNNKYLDALAAVMDFESKFASSNLADRARDVGLKAFGRIVAQLIQDENYPKIVNLWRDYPFVREATQGLDPEAKIALGLSFWKRGMPREALDVVRPFINEEQVPEHSEVAMSLALSIYADNGKWEDVLGVADAVDEWALRPDFQRELNYAKALALENLGRFEESRPLWVELGNDRELDREQRAYAIFFLAQEALADDRLRDAYEYGQDAYEMLLQQGGDEAKVREVLRILMDVTERSSRFREALKWATELEEMIPREDPSWAALRYRMAGMYRKASDLATWREMLTELAESRPDTLYGRMAESDLELEELEQASREYQPQGAF